ncbi:MAG: endonuclease V [Thermoanaerobaculia bacterium]
MGKDFTPSPYKVVGGCDCAYSRDGKIQICVAVVLDSKTLETLEYSFSKFQNPAPYIPGKFYLREGEISIKTIKKLKNFPDLLLIDGHGKANVEGKGLACYIGENIKVPTLGIAKELLFGEFLPLGEEKGSLSEVFYKNKTIAYALRTRENKNPLFISEGYGINFLEIKDFFLSLCIYKNPEPLRIAHILAKKILKDFL